MDAPFASGEQNKSFVCASESLVKSDVPLNLITVQQTVNDTDSTYFYCGTPGHCPMGMFGIMYVRLVVLQLFALIDIALAILPMRRWAVALHCLA